MRPQFQSILKAMALAAWIAPTQAFAQSADAISRSVSVWASGDSVSSRHVTLITSKIDAASKVVSMVTAQADAVSRLSSLEAYCLADVDDGTRQGQRDRGVTIDDLLYFVGVFAEGTLEADVDDGTFTGTPDGGVTIDDLLYYLQRYEGGC